MSKRAAKSKKPVSKAKKSAAKAKAAPKRAAKAKPVSKAKTKPAPKPSPKANPTRKAAPAAAPAAPIAAPPSPVVPAPAAPAPAPVSPPLSAMPANLANKVCLSALSFTPMGFLPCDGSLASVSAAPTAFALLGKKYGGDGKSTFGLPNLSAVAPASATLHYVLPLDPKYSPLTSQAFSESDNLGFIRLLNKGATLPQGYLYCDGSILQIPSDCAFFALLGATFGGDGVKTFAVPDLRQFEKSLAGARYIIAECGLFPNHG